MTTKDQERQAIEKIRKIVEGLGENSYVGFAMEGVLELAEDNIREDTAYSMKKNAEIAWERADKAETENKDLKKEVEDLKKTVEKRGATISELNTELCNARAEAKANEIPEELVQEMYCMAYDKEAESIGKMERAADQMAASTFAREDVHGFAEEYKKQKANRSRYRKVMEETGQERKTKGRKRMRKKYYHAATPETMEKIIADGVVKRGWDGCVYLCEKPQDAAKFVAIRGHEIVDVIEVILPADKVKESSDHSIQFFQCRAYRYEEDVKIRQGARLTEYSFK